MLFSEAWNLEDLNGKAEQVLHELEAEGWIKYIVPPKVPQNYRFLGIMKMPKK